MPALVIITFFVVAGIFTMIVLSHGKTFKMTSTTTGQVTSSTQREMRTDAERWDETVVVFKYTVHGKDYESQTILRGRRAARFAPGSTVAIRYNPAEPAMAAIGD